MEIFTQIVHEMEDKGPKGITMRKYYLKATKNYTQAILSEPIAFIMGAEDEGVSPDHLRLCDEMVSIPMSGSIASLNVSVATGVLLYEAVRQRSIVDAVIG